MLHAHALLSALLSIAIVASVSVAVEPNDPKSPVVLPLKEVWALAMPGTKAFPSTHKDDAGNYVSSDGQVSQQLNEAFASVARSKESTEGFVVAGTGIDSLKALTQALQNSTGKRDAFTTEEELNIVFYALEYGSDVHLTNITRDKSEITLSYRFAPHFEANVSSNLAVIPLGKMPQGNYSVKLARQPLERKYQTLKVKNPSKKEASRVVCKPFRFTVNDATKEH
ncbi:hypothetical protein [Lacipirellula parvula]|uniref:Dolichyl-diphosphooligosaccharide--protein glycosyltransferase subunit 2 n=1 Tax=Lacipirellula parvula TaxID=2650471 RepID=A0A5K7X9J2_9BACT|nr:hypothetical protein [Lacipirellula parvula]BBO33404.1 hypothetical protein PLANPX_3016 [Lacipirellula parvula]